MTKILNFIDKNSFGIRIILTILGLFLCIIKEMKLVTFALLIFITWYPVLKWRL